MHARICDHAANAGNRLVPTPLRPHDIYSPLPVLADDGAARRAVCGGYLRDKKEVDGLRAPSRATARKAAHGAASIA